MLCKLSEYWDKFYSKHLLFNMNKDVSFKTWLIQKFKFWEITKHLRLHPLAFFPNQNLKMVNFRLAVLQVDSLVVSYRMLKNLHTSDIFIIKSKKVISYSKWTHHKGILYNLCNHVPKQELCQVCIFFKYVLEIVYYWITLFHT